MPCFCGNTEPHVDGVHSWGVPLPVVEERDHFRDGLIELRDHSDDPWVQSRAQELLDFLPTWHRIKT